MSSLTLTGGSLAVATPFDRAFVDDLKAKVPYSARRWNAPTKQWLVDPGYGPLVAGLIQQYFGEQVIVPAAGAAPAVVTTMVQMLYLGRCKMRDFNTTTASGYANDQWSLSFPEQVLRDYFNDAPVSTASNAPPVPTSLYATLGLAVYADAGAIKTAYRRMAKVWHPDICKEADAKERFQAVNRAYDVLSDDKLRRKYDAGLTLELRANKSAAAMTTYYTPNPADYRAPLTCGLLMVEGIEKLGVLHVAKILHWADVTNELGQTMVSSWPVGADNFEIRWV